MKINQSLYIAASEGKGRGVFTKKNITADKVVEIAPVIVMTGDERMLIDKTRLHDYIFEWKPNGENMCCMALGWIPVYNHSQNANCEYVMDYEEQTISVVSIRHIQAGEEVTINYNGDWNDRTPVWFELKAE